MKILKEKKKMTKDIDVLLDELENKLNELNSEMIIQNENKIKKINNILVKEL